MQEKKQEIRYCHYETPPELPAMALLEESAALQIKDGGKLHFHNCLEIGYCCGGTGTLYVDNNSRPFSAGDVSVIPPFHLHNRVSHDGAALFWEYLYVDVEALLAFFYRSAPAMADRIIRSVHSQTVVLCEETDRAITGLALEAMNLFRSREDLYQESVKGLLLAFLARLAALYGDSPRQDPTPPPPGQAVLEALEYVGKNFKSKIAVRDMAKACHLSEPHFRRLFVRSMQMPPLAYVNFIRVKAACKLLRTTGEPVKDIAANCGFDTLASFNRNFKELTGVSPLQWRRYSAGERDGQRQSLSVL